LLGEQGKDDGFVRMDGCAGVGILIFLSKDTSTNVMDPNSTIKVFSRCPFELIREGR